MLESPALSQPLTQPRPGSVPLSGAGRWTWSDLADPTPQNRLTWFRTTFELDELPPDGRLLFAADSNAWLWINGHVVRRKVTRYHEELITAEVVLASPYLRRGTNVIVLLHHNWGDIITFQRTGQRHAGWFLDSAWLHSGAQWRWHVAPEYLEHAAQVRGICGGAMRIRYPQLINLAHQLPGDLHAPDYDASGWAEAQVVENGPWPAVPEPVETPGQRESFQPPLGVIAAGWLAPRQPLADDPTTIGRGICTAQLHPDAGQTRDAAALVAGEQLWLSGTAGSSRYVTLEFQRPLHGFPVLEWAAATPGVRIDIGYGEITHAEYDGRRHVDADGWVNTEGVVGAFYADRVITAEGAGSVTLPDERTARWLTLHIHFEQDGELTLSRVGMIKSQYALRPRGTFACGDERVEQIVKLCLIHAEVTMSDTYVDTPGREDGQWIEDARPRALLSERWFGDHALRRLMIRTLAQSQGPDGQLHPFAPSNYPAYPASYDWSMQWVAMLYDDYMWTGQTDVVERYWPNLVAYCGNLLGCMDAQGLWCSSNLLGDLRTSQNPTLPHQSSGLVTSWIVDRLRWSAEMARALDQQAEAATWEQAAATLAETFRTQHLIAASGQRPALVGDLLDPRDPDCERGLSQAAQTIAVLAGLLQPAEARAAVDYVFAEPDGSPPPDVVRWNNPTWAYRALRAMSDTGRTERAVRHLIERYAPYLPGNPRNVTEPALQGPYGGPLPEYWISREDASVTAGRELAPGQINNAHPGDETGSHGWGAVPLLWLHDTLLGVRLAEPGGARLHIEPQAGGLPYVAGTTMTPRGAVWVYYDPQQSLIEIELPAGVVAEVVFPKAFRGRHVCDTQGNLNHSLGSERTLVLESPGLHTFVLC